MCRVFSFALTFLVGLFFYSVAMAQDGEVDPRLHEMQEAFGTGPQEEDIYRAERLLVTATGSQVPVHLAPSVASVITAEDIKKIGASSLDDILEIVPGLHVQSSGLGFLASIWSIRGIHTQLNQQVLFLLNGLPYSSLHGGRPLIYRMPVAMISRVEVIRGPGSAVFGADAFAGVVNVITKDNFEIDGSQVGVRYGSFESSDIWGQHGSSMGGWDYWGSIESWRSDGDHDRVVQKDYLHAIGAAASSNAPGYLDTQFDETSAYLGLRKNNLALRLHGSWYDDYACGPGTIQALTYENDIDGHGLLADLEYRDRKFTKDWDLGLRIFSNYLNSTPRYQILPEDFLNMVGEPGGVYWYTGVEATGIYQGFDRHRIRVAAGLRWYDEEPEQYKNFGDALVAAGVEQYGEPIDISDTPYVFMEPQNRMLSFLSLQDEWDLAPFWSFTGGVRFDDYSDFGSTINPRVALVWEARHDLTAKLMYGSAFRAPSFSEQHMQNNVMTIGNSDLDPETIDTYELAFVYQPMADLMISLNLFYYEAEGLIEYIGALPAPAENHGQQTGQGFEVDFDWQAMESLRIRSNIAYQHAIDKRTDSDVPEASTIQFYLNPYWTFGPQWSLDGQYLYVGGRHRDAADPRDDIDDYDIVNLTLRRKNIANHWEVALAVRNLFDEDAREPSPYDPDAPEGAYIPNDYPMEGRAVWAELSCRF